MAVSISQPHFLYHSWVKKHITELSFFPYVFIVLPVMEYVFILSNFYLLILSVFDLILQIYLCQESMTHSSSSLHKPNLFLLVLVHSF